MTTMRIGFLVFLGLVLVAGCGGSRLAPVSGTVTLDGLPVENAGVMFQPIGDGQLNPGAGSFGRTNAKGEFTLELIGGGGKGAVVGWHKVHIDPPVEAPNIKIPRKYVFKSELKFEVKPGDNTVNFPLSTKR
jgi:hypothetical protein